MEPMYLLIKLLKKQIISYAYLLLALIIAASFVITVPYISWYGWPIDHGLYVEAKIAAILLYLMHWIYGALIFPIRYRAYVKAIMKKTYSKINYEKDISHLRGLLALIPMMYIIICSGDHYGTSAGVVCLIWIIITIVLIRSTRTDNLFEEKKIRLNLKIILPELFENNSGEYMTYADVPYCSPKHIKEDAWEKAISESYCLYLLNQHREKNMVENKTIKLSEEIADRINAKKR